MMEPSTLSCSMAKLKPEERSWLKNKLLYDLGNPILLIAKSRVIGQRLDLIRGIPHGHPKPGKLQHMLVIARISHTDDRLGLQSQMGRQRRDPASLVALRVQKLRK